MQTQQEKLLTEEVDCRPGRALLQRDLALEVLRDHGSVTFRAMGTSMLPAIWPGDVLSIERTATERIQRGDVVLFRRAERLFVHRVVAFGGGADCVLITRGDSVPQPDPTFPSSDLLGRVKGIVRGGRSIRLERSPGPLSRMASWLFRQPDWLSRPSLMLHACRRRMALGPLHVVVCRSDPNRDSNGAVI